MIFAQPFVGFFDVEAPDAFQVGAYNKGRGRSPRHHVGVIATSRTARNQAAILVHHHHGVDEGLGYFGIDQVPKAIDGPLRTPERVGVVVVVFGLAFFVERDLADAAFGAGHVAVFSIYIADDAAALQGVPKVGVKTAAFGIGTSFNLDAAQPLVPVAAAVLYGFFKIPMRQFGVEVEAGLCFTHVRNGDFHFAHLASLGGKTDVSASSGTVNQVADFFQLAIAPAFESVEGFVKNSDKKHRNRFGAANGGRHDGIAFDFLVADFADMAFLGIRWPQKSGKIKEDMTLFGFWESVLVKTYPGGSGQFRSYVVGVQDYFVVTGFDDFFFVCIF